MKSVNKITLLGNVGNDPESKTVGAGTLIAKLSVATNETWTDKSGTKQEKTQWHRCTAFGKLAEIIQQYVKKGDRLYLEGRVEYSQSEHEGTTRYFTDVVVQDMVMLGSTGERTEAPESRPAKRGTGMDAGSYKGSTSVDDGLPFAPMRLTEPCR